MLLEKLHLLYYYLLTLEKGQILLFCPVIYVITVIYVMLVVISWE